MNPMVEESPQEEAGANGMTPAEGELEKRLKAGDEDALAAIFTMHRERLWRQVNFRLNSRLKGRLDPDDVLQEAYLAAAQRVERYGEDGFESPFLWLRLIVRQTLIDVHRRHLDAQKRDARRELPLHGKHRAYAQATSISLASYLVGNLTAPTRAMARREAMEMVRTAIEMMKPLDQEVLALRHFEELTNSEVADELGIQPKAASIRYVRAVKRLRDVLADLPRQLGGQHA
jgi:RNA polymerase sigma-70 factor (ECF subfamily)